MSEAGLIYEGRVSHTRSRPIRNSFSYRVWFVYVDIDRLDELAAQVPSFGHNGGGLVQVRDSDHGPRDGSPLRPWIDGVLARAGIDLGGEGRVMLLTFGRVSGAAFFPVAFWYCFGSDGLLRAVLAEVNNTFGEHHDYLLHNNGRVLEWSDRPEAVKAFRVSPFIEMDARYTFSFEEPADRLALSILDVVEGERLLVTSLDLSARALDDAELRRCVWTLGPMPLRAGALIGYQALKLLAKGMRWLQLPPAPEEEVSL